MNHPHIFGEGQKEPLNFKAMTKNFSSDTLWHEWLYASLVYVFLESGFCVAKKADGYLSESATYNARTMALYAQHPIETLYEKRSLNYSCKLYCIAEDRCPSVCVQGSASCTSLSQYFIINVVVKTPSPILLSLCMKSTDFTVKNRGVCMLKKTCQLAQLFRDNCICPVKAVLLPLLLKNQCAPLLQCLPDLVMDKICNFLKVYDCRNLQCALRGRT